MVLRGARSPVLGIRWDLVRSPLLWFPWKYNPVSNVAGTRVRKTWSGVHLIPRSVQRPVAGWLPGLKSEAEDSGQQMKTLELEEDSRLQRKTLVCRGRVWYTEEDERKTGPWRMSPFC